MKILIDLQSCQSGSRHGGIGRYSMNLASAMVRNAGQHEIHFLLNASLADGLQELKDELATLVSPTQIHCFAAIAPTREIFEENKFRARASEYTREAVISNLNPDIVHVTSLIEGLHEDVVTSVGRLFPGSLTAVILYDLIPMVEHDKYLRDSRVEAHYFRKIDEMKNAGVLLAISEFSRREGIELLDIPDDRVTNISSAVDSKFQPIKFPEPVIAELKSRYGIDDKYLMYTGSFDQRKNHATLIKAFAQLPLDIRGDVQLLIVGNGWDDVYAHLRSVAAEAGLAPRDVIFAGKVPDQDLLPLYNACHLLVFPSLQEGFGLPVLEAMSCGTPVIGSNTTSIPEVIGLEEALFDPYSVDSVSEKIAQVLRDEPFRQHIRQHGLARSKEFSWDISAQKALAAMERQIDREQGRAVKAVPCSVSEVIQKIVSLPEARNASYNDQIALAMELEKVEQIRSNTARELLLEKNNVGFISTWNTRCGIASYSEQLIKYLPYTPVIFAPYASEQTQADTWNVLRCWQSSHDDLKELSARIEEFDIKTLVIQFNYGFFDFGRLSVFLDEQISQGREVIITLHSTSDPAGVTEKRLSLLAASLSKCRKVLIHSPKDAERLKQLGVQNVAIFPHGVLQHDPKHARAINPRSFKIASYGFFLPNKGLLELIEAVSQLRASGLNVQLMMVNARYPAPVSETLIANAKQLVATRGLTEHVRIIDDYLPDESSLALLEEADILVYPYQKTGESSSAAVRTGLVTKRPIAVTPLSIFEDVGDAVFYLPGTTPEDISAGILDIIEQASTNSEGFTKVMSQLENWLERHQYSSVSSSLNDLITKRIAD